MCVGDWRIGRFIRSVTRSTTIVSPATLTLGPNPQRVGIMFSGDAVQIGGGNSLGILVDGNQVSNITQQTPTVFLSLASNGDLPTRQMVLLPGIAATMTVGITEFFLPEEFLQSGTDQWKKELMR